MHASCCSKTESASLQEQTDDPYKSKPNVPSPITCHGTRLLYVPSTHKIPAQCYVETDTAERPHLFPF